MIRLGIPVVVSRLGVLLMSMVGTVMVGRYGTEALAFQSLAIAVDTLLIMIVQGLLQGVIVMTANAYGEGDYHACGAVLRRTIPYTAVIACGCMAVCLPSETLMGLLGQPPEIAHGAARVLSLSAISLPFYVFFCVMSFFMEGTKRPVPGMILVIIANIVQAVACYAFIYGHFGFPQLGATGFAISLTIVRIVLAIGMFICVFCIDENDEFGVWVTPKQNREQAVRLRHIGYGAAATAASEEGAYSVVNIMAGWLGTLSLGAYTVMLNAINNAFTLAQGVGTASSVLIGIARGKESVTEMRVICWTALALNTLLLTVVSVFLLLIPDLIASIYTTDDVLIKEAVPLLMMCSLMSLFDGGQQVLISLLRGIVDITVPAVMQVVSFGGVMLLLIWLFSFELNMGVRGMAYAMTIACFCAFFLLLSRFLYVCRRFEKEGFGIRL